MAWEASTVGDDNSSSDEAGLVFFTAGFLCGLGAAAAALFAMRAVALRRGTTRSRRLPVDKGCARAAREREVGA